MPMIDPTPVAAYPHSAPQLRIAVLEDDDVLRDSILLPTLRDYGFEPAGARTAAELYRLMLQQNFDIVLLDIGLPDESGLEVVGHLRQLSSRLGIVMLTGSRGREKRIRALSAGADAFLAKPVDGAVLAATLFSLARRLAQPQGDASSSAAPQKEPPPKPPVRKTSPPRWRLEADDWCLVMPNGGKLALTAQERCVLRMLADAGGRPVSREALVNALAGGNRDFDPHRLEMLVHRLRRKAASIEGKEELPLLSSRGVGYLFAAS